jgi:hypothetical protein
MAVLAVGDGTSRMFSNASTYVPRTPWGAGSALLATLVITVAGVLTLMGLLSIDKVARGLGRAQGLWRGDVGTLLTLMAWQAVTIALTIGASALFGAKSVRCWPFDRRRVVCACMPLARA